MYSLIDEFIKSWDRPVREVKGWKATETEDGVLIVANALGIGKEDLKLELNKGTLTLKGETEEKEIDFVNKVSYSWDISKYLSELQNIDYEARNGLVFIHLNLEEEKSNIKIKYKE
jgi:HSP20 family molecular chaperone IbpA